MKILGIDWGRRTLGIAISDGKLGLAFPRPSIKNDKKAINSLSEIVSKERVSKIVVGHPLRMSGEDSESTDDAKEFYEKLKNKMKKVEIVLFDERFTTKVVETAMNRENESRKRIREKKDSLSAVIILQNYLDANKK
ncbi:Holliday junction resolvase RuvX [bacterium]|nr:Holliday junction resolvase RuvX [bacterium]